MSDPQLGIARLVLGATDGAPIELNNLASTISNSKGVGFGIEAAHAALAETERTFEPFKERMHALALHRAVVRAFDK